MKKLTIILVTIIAIVASASVIFAQTAQKSDLPKEIQDWERLAEKGDTAAMHKLIRFYDDNCHVTFEVEGVVEVEAEEVYVDSAWVVYADSAWVGIDDAECDSVAYIPDELSALYSARLEYWLAKGLEIEDPVATYIKGMRLYYSDQAQAIPFLSKAAEMGNSRAALFCGSALFNKGRGMEAIKYLKIADELGEPCAGWHLAMCYVGNAGVEENDEMAIHYLVKSALKDCPEAVLEMRRIDPERDLWKQKADSLELDMPDFPIILTE